MVAANPEARIAELEVSQRRAEVISQINAALSRATDEQGILSAVAGLAEQNGVAGSALAYANTDASGQVVGATVVAMQMQGQPVDIKTMLTTDDFPLDANPILRFALENPDEPLFVENMFTDPRTETGTTREAFRYSGMTATVILWFRAGGKVQGVMTFNWVNEQPFNDEVREVFKAIQPVAAAVIANRRLMLELEKTVEERTAALRESEERLARAQKVGGLGTWEMDLKADTVYWSDLMFEITGRDPSSGMPGVAKALNIVHPEDQEKVNIAIQQSTQQKVPVELDVRLIAEDGTLRYIHMAVSVVAEGSGQAAKIIGTMQDITPRYLAELERERLAAIVNTSRDCMGIADLEGRSIYINPAGVKMLGYDSLEELVDMPLLQFHDAETGKFMSEVAVPTAMQQGSWRGENRIRRKDGQSISVDQTILPILDTNGQPVAIATIISDISERKQNEAALRESEAKFRRILESLPIGIHIYENDDEDRLVFSGWNTAASRMIGMDCSQFSGKTLEEAFPSLIGTEIPQRYREAAKTGQTWRTDQVVYNEGAISGAFEVYAFQGLPGSAVIAFMDVTDRIRQQEERDKLQKQVIEAQRQALAELSTPIIPIMDRIIVMPLVGGIDTGRSRDIMRSLLEGISQYRAQIAILDITGVPVVDSGVADHLNRTMQAARLKGAQTIITGVSDAVAETIVDLGIDWSGFETLRDLQTGLVTALERVGLRLVQKTNGEKRV